VSEPLPLGHLGSILSLRVILVRPKTAPSSTMGGPQQLCFGHIHTWHPSACHHHSCVRSSWLVLHRPSHGWAAPSPDEMRLHLSLSQTWAWHGQSREETREKQQAARGHGISQHLKTRSSGTPKSAWTGEGGATERAWLLLMDGQIGQRNWLAGQSVTARGQNEPSWGSYKTQWIPFHIAFGFLSHVQINLDWRQQVAT